MARWRRVGKPEGRADTTVIDVAQTLLDEWPAMLIDGFNRIAYHYKITSIDQMGTRNFARAAKHLGITITSWVGPFGKMIDAPPGTDMDAVALVIFINLAAAILRR